jgi:hypothetical protein
MKQPILRALCAFAYLSGLAHAAGEPPLPVLLQLPDDIGVQTGGESGLIGILIDRNTNRRSAERVRRFKEGAAGFDFAASASETLACVAASQGDTCAQPQIIIRDKTGEATLTAALAELPQHRALLISLTPEMTSEALMLRAVASELSLRKERVVREHITSTIVMRRAPAALTQNAKANPGALEDFWFAGDQPLVLDVAREALAETALLMSALRAELAGSDAAPKSWKELPKLAGLEKTGRAKCNGTPCSNVRIFRDTPEKIWVVHVPEGMMGVGVPRDYGVVMGSFDAPAAAFQLNLWAYLVIGLYTR